MRLLNLAFLLLFILLTFTSCQTDFDIEEVAPVEHLESAEHEDHNHSEGEDCSECDAEDSEHISIDDQVEESHSGHEHASGARNHGTEWFFNQPWAAPFIWNKLIRDGLIFLVLAVAIFLFSGKWKKR